MICKESNKRPSSVYYIIFVAKHLFAFRFSFVRKQFKNFKRTFQKNNKNVKRTNFLHVRIFIDLILL